MFVCLKPFDDVSLYTRFDTPELRIPSGCAGPSAAGPCFLCGGRSFAELQSFSFRSAFPCPSRTHPPIFRPALGEFSTERVELVPARARQHRTSRNISDRRDFFWGASFDPPERNPQVSGPSSRSCIKTAKGSQFPLARGLHGPTPMLSTDSSWDKNFVSFLIILTSVDEAILTVGFSGVYLKVCIPHCILCSTG